jgi:GT2 family glycosyltransferase
MSWATTILSPQRTVIHDPALLPNKAPVLSLPFLGFLINRELVQRIGMPDASYFIAADDIEYCLRARSAGAKIFVSGKSRIDHPKALSKPIRFLGREINYLSLPPWKRYYDTRNRVLNARRYARIRLFTEIIPGWFLRLGIALIKEPKKAAQLKAFVAGFADGILNHRGIRHIHWGLLP